ncbi:MAG: glycosyltransferase family 2 protein [Gammaproteobacteria bacterium]|nr:glycosyltransferase family 2 protein [Gammaproteobacteria bacterium]
MNEPAYCILVPHFNHLPALQAFLPTLLALDLPGIVVDDGSRVDVKDKLRDLLAPYSDFELAEHAANKGKGAAILTGARLARARGFSHILQIDADGQHDVSDAHKFIEYSKSSPEQIVSGSPTFDHNAPKARVHGRKITNFWVALETLSFGVKDSLCGFRIYPLTQFEQVAENYHLGLRMDFDTEILVKAVWHGISLHFIRTRVIYPPQSVSHFHYLRDNLNLIWLHTRLMAGMLIRLPRLLVWRLSGRTASTP